MNIMELIALLTSLAINTEFYLIQPIMLQAAFKLSPKNQSDRLLNVSNENEDAAHENLLYYAMVMNISQASVIFFVSYIMGLVSDIYNCTKKIIVLQQIGNCFPFLVLIFLNSMENPTVILRLTIVVNIITGITGGTLGFMTMLSAYVSKTCSPNEQTIKFSYIEAWYTAGLIAAQAVGGLTLRFFKNHLHCILVAFVPLVLSIACSVQFLSDGKTVDRNRRNEHSEIEFNLKGIVKDIASYYDVAYRKRTPLQRLCLLLAFTIIFILTLSIVGGTTVTYSYLRKSPVGLSDTEIAMFLCANQLCIFLGLKYGLPLFKKYTSDLNLCIITILARAIVYFLLIFTQSYLSIMCINVFYLFCGFEVCILKSYCGQFVGKEENARLLALFCSFQSIGLIFSQAITKIHSITLRNYRYAVFSGCCILDLICVFIVAGMILMQNNKNKKNNQTNDDEEATKVKLVAQ
ncbi:hypothetical protein ACOME3_000640 [Neoechinorhynchus agilis]